MQSFKYLGIFLISFISAFFIWSIIDLYLPKTAPIFTLQSTNEKFYNINLVRIFFTSTTPQNLNINKTLKGFKLKAVYIDKNNSFIIIEKDKKTHFLNINDKINGYRLIKILPTQAIFEKNNQKFKLSFKKIKLPSQKETLKDKIIQINKNTISKYKKNLSLIWQEIGIVKSQQGYKITYIKPNSIFSKIGLKKGDVILEINNMPLKNDADAWRIYNKIEKFSYIELLIKRNNTQKVLRYEMD